MKRKQPFTFDEFKAIYSKVPRLCVELIIKTDKGVLLTLRQKNGYEGQWHIPGGTVYYREPIEQAVRRIAEEELGIQVSIDQFYNYQEYFSEVKERGFGYSVSLVFLCTPTDSSFRLDNQVEEARYFRALPENVIEEQRKILSEVLGQNS